VRIGVVGEEGQLAEISAREEEAVTAWLWACWEILTDNYLKIYRCTKPRGHFNGIPLSLWQTNYLAGTTVSRSSLGTCGIWQQCFTLTTITTVSSAYLTPLYNSCDGFRLCLCGTGLRLYAARNKLSDFHKTEAMHCPDVLNSHENNQEDYRV
jgi:hypothetical protein